MGFTASPAYGESSGVSPHWVETLVKIGMHLSFLLVMAGLVACASSEAGVEAAITRVEDEMADRVVPALAEHGDTEVVWDSFNEALQAARTEDLHVVRGPDSGSHSTGEETTLVSVVTIVGSDVGECLAVSVSSDGTVKSIAVSGDPADNCAGAQVPDPASF